MTSRLKSLGFGSKRKSSANIQTNSVASPNGSISTTATTPPPPNSSQTSLPPMNQQGAPGRPPSYSYQTVQGRPQSPLPPPQNQMAHPPPIDTRQNYMGGNPQLGPPQPPGYGGAYAPIGPQPGIQHTANQYAPGRAAEVEASNRNKAQLIVGIDFVSWLSQTCYAPDTDCHCRGQPFQVWHTLSRRTQKQRRI